MQTSRKAIGILGGTFDPIHLGHLRMAIELHEALHLTKVHIVPCYQPVHRGSPLASAEERLAMVNNAILNEPALYADAREINRRKPSYSIDTILDLREEMPDTQIYLLLGIDAFLSFPTWHRFQEILDHVDIVVAHRPQYQLPETGAIADLLKTYTKKIVFQPITALEISASAIRKQIAMQRNPRYLLPDGVYEYIKQHNIYANRI